MLSVNWTVACVVAVDGGWSSWSAWESCQGHADVCQCRSRSCSSPQPQFGGRQCAGARMQVDNCTSGKTLIFTSLVRHSLLHVHLSHMAVHHLHHLHYHHLHLLLLVQSFILNLTKLGFSANHFLHSPFPFLPDWPYGLSDHVFILLNGWICLHGVLD